MQRRKFIAGLAGVAAAGAAGLGLGTFLPLSKVCAAGPPLIHGPRFTIFAFEGTTPVNQIAMMEHVSQLASHTLGESQDAYYRLRELFLMLDDHGWETGLMSGSLTGERTGWKSIVDSVHWRIKPFYYRSIELNKDTLLKEPMTPMYWGGCAGWAHDEFSILRGRPVYPEMVMPNDLPSAWVYAPISS